MQWFNEHFERWQRMQCCASEKLGRVAIGTVAIATINRTLLYIFICNFYQLYITVFDNFWPDFNILLHTVWEIWMHSRYLWIAPRSLEVMTWILAKCQHLCGQSHIACIAAMKFWEDCAFWQTVTHRIYHMPSNCFMPSWNMHRPFYHDQHTGCLVNIVTEKTMN